ncbi:hypothetical protein ACFQAV_05350 [Companilactobacillus huachuanensis]|uniref:Uncharacterized protein n=1 Tax=Companilactobacillus huachuanensis TaxID=2559914 RepID=A0ABW1RNR1_9LACO|nr:hypothetical protein [Companilactobacillus huachuanensis]
MEAVEQLSDVRPLNTVDVAYMEAAMEILEKLRIIEIINTTGLATIDLDDMELEHFTQWLMILCNPDNQFQLSPLKDVSFSAALTRAPSRCFPHPLSAHQLGLYLQRRDDSDSILEFAMVVKTLPALQILHEIINR